jgi:peptidoglycan/xylan/chitin deacetylase (PgdA/CDA1 family)
MQSSMKNIKRIILRAAGRLGMNELAGVFASHKAFCIGYHSITSSRNSNELSAELYANLSIDEADFDKQLSYLKSHGHTFVTVGGMLEAVRKGTKKPTAIYFDDGYKDNLLNALPILSKYGVPATIFVTADAIDRSNILWTIALRSLYKQIKKTPDESEKKIEEYKTLPAHEAAAKVAEEYKGHDLSLTLEQFKMFLDWDEVKGLVKAGIEIGSHTVSHPNLTKIDTHKIRLELAESKKRIEEKISQPVVSLSYPYGRLSPEIVELTKAAGYHCAVAGSEGWNDFEGVWSHPFEIRKIAPRPKGDIFDFAIRLYLRPLLNQL